MRPARPFDLPENEEAGNFRCLECGSIFLTESLIESHIQQQHNPMNIYNCLRCKRSFKDNWHLKKHLISHQQRDTSEKVYVCHVCKKIYKDPWMLQKHNSGGCCIQEIVDDTEDSKAIEVIDAESKSDRKSRMHYETEWFELNQDNVEEPEDRHKTKSTDFFSCRLCGQVLGRELFESHLETHWDDLFQTREDQENSLKLYEEGDSPTKRVKLEACRKCGNSVKLLEEVKQTLDLLVQTIK